MKRKATLRSNEQTGMYYYDGGTWYKGEKGWLVRITVRNDCRPPREHDGVKVYTKDRTVSNHRISLVCWSGQDTGGDLVFLTKVEQRTEGR